MVSSSTRYPERWYHPIGKFFVTHPGARPESCHATRKKTVTTVKLWDTFNVNMTNTENSLNAKFNTLSYKVV